MTELDILRHAKMYMDKLANGIDPIMDQAAPEEDIINNVRLSRCFFYVSGVLEKVIENGGVVGKRPRPTQPFALTYDQIRRYEFPDVSIPITALAQGINALSENEDMKKLKYTSISQFLEQSGMLEVVEQANGRKAKRPTDAGRSIGIYTEERTGQNGPYTAVLYNRGAQQFILDNRDQ